MRDWLRKWAIVVVSVLWLATELLGASGVGDVRTLTEVIVTYVPVGVTEAGVAALVGWLAWHFKRRYDKGTGPTWAKAFTGAMTAALGVLGTAALDDKITSGEQYAIVSAALLALAAVYHAPNDDTSSGVVRVKTGAPPR